MSPNTSSLILPTVDLPRLVYLVFNKENIPHQGEECQKSIGSRNGFYGDGKNKDVQEPSSAYQINVNNIIWPCLLVPQIIKAMLHIKKMHAQKNVPMIGHFVWFIT